MYNGADGILPDFIDSGQWMHHYHLLFGYGHDVWGEDELAETLRKKKKQIHMHKSLLLQSENTQLLSPCWKK